MLKGGAAHAADAARLTGIAFSIKCYRGYADDLIELWADELTISEGFLRTHPVYCAVRDGESVGFSALSRRWDEDEVDHIWVAPKHMGGGIDQALFARTVSSAATFGGAVFVIVADLNAEGFYCKMGTQRVGHVPAWPQGCSSPLLRSRYPTG